MVDIGWWTEKGKIRERTRRRNIKAEATVDTEGTMVALTGEGEKIRGAKSSQEVVCGREREREKRNNRAVDIINQEEVRKGNVGGEGERRAKKKLTRENERGW